MAKQKIKYVCSNCGYETLRWVGKCPECENWNTFTEELIESSRRKPAKTSQNIPLHNINEIKADEEERIKTGINELDRVLGGGFMPGSVVLLGGDPGIGKSTLAMQIASGLQEKVLYVTGEESLKQIKLRADRLKIIPHKFFILPETDLSPIISAIEETKAPVVIIDSIQTIYRTEYENAPGTITQLRECTAALQEEAKKNNLTVILIGHVTKEGFIAGPKILEHIVDTVIQFEGESGSTYRILRSQKNRFGSTNEIGIFEMLQNGLREVTNPSEIFLSGRGTETSGSVITATVEGTRPILLEVQALVTPGAYGYPQRVSNGFDQRRLSILLAVLEKRAKLKLSNFNVFVNIAGGLRVMEPSVDLAVCAGIVSSLRERLIKKNTVAIGEVGLGGEMRSVSQIEKRIQEAEKLGFENIVLPAGNLKGKKIKSRINIIPAEDIISAIKSLLKE